MDKMRFDEFSNMVVDRVKEFLPSQFEKANVSLQVVNKSNDIQLTGLTITSATSNIAPTIYLESFFEGYEYGEEMDSILERIAKIRLEHEVDEQFDTSIVTDFEACKYKIIPRLVGAELNERLMEIRPHTLMDGLVVFYHIQLDSCDDGMATIPVTYELMRMWSIDVEELHHIAISNLPILLPSTFKGLNEVMFEMTGMELPFFDEMIYVLSNIKGINGATALLDKEIMNDVIDLLGEDFLVIPSSLHEVLIISPNAGMCLADMLDLVKTVNETEVRVEDKLSDSVFKYSVDKGIYRA